MKNNTVMRMTAGAAMSGALLLFGGAAVASAQPGDGRVDLAIGTAGVLTDVPIDAASQIAADVCKGDLGELTVTAESVDTAGAQQSACTNALGAVDFRQNGMEQQGMTEEPGTAEGASFSEEPAEPTDETVEDGTTGEAPVTTTTTVPEGAPAG
ncbi:hypothetical protein ACWDUN_19835 [Mycobacterium sp. NPDC003323]